MALPTTATGNSPERAAGTQYALKEGDSFLVCDAFGDMHGRGDGLFRADTRVLSSFRLELGGLPPSLLSAAISHDNVLFTSNVTNMPLPAMGERAMPHGVIHLQRVRFLWQGRMYERVSCVNYDEAEVAATLRLIFCADFRDIFEVRGMTRAARGRLLEPRIEQGCVVLGYDGLDGVQRRTVIAFSAPPDRLEGGCAEYHLALPRLSRTDLYLEVGTAVAEPCRARFRLAAAGARRTMRARRRRGARPRSNARLFNAWLERSRSDIALLVSEMPTGPYPCAGIPWFATPFGRDGIITALQLLWLDTSLARGVLGYLAEHQAREYSSFHDAAPGKIMHETRAGEMAALGEVPFGRYYGGVDTTPLFVMLAGAYADRTADHGFIDRLWPALCAATAWIERTCDADPDGFLTYAQGEEGGLLNQGWKDSEDSVFHRDGSFPSAPIALVEVQGYVFAALETMGRLATRRGDEEEALRWHDRAAALRAAVERLFWDAQLSTYGIARDGQGMLCRVRSSNAGHLLYVGLPIAERAACVIRVLRSAPFDGGWGVRTLGMHQPRFNPMSYHDGSVWPHDMAICAAGMARYGERTDTVRLLGETYEAAVHFGMRLPELFCGFGRSLGEPPIAYPVACLPQAWAAGSVFMMLQACLGVRIDAQRGQVRVDEPVLPEGVDRLVLHRLAIGGASIDLGFERIGGRTVAFRAGGDPDVRIISRI